MINQLTWKLSFALATLFGVGVATGFIAGRQSVKPHAPQSSIAPGKAANFAVRPEQMLSRWKQQRLNEYKRIINPTPQQEEAIRKHFDSMRTDYTKLRSEAKKEVMRSIIRLHHSIAGELTPEQRRAFNEHFKKNKREQENPQSIASENN